MSEAVSTGLLDRAIKRITEAWRDMASSVSGEPDESLEAQMQACLDLVPVRFALCIEIVASGLAIDLRAHRDPLERPYGICTEILRWTFKDSNARIGAVYRAS